MSFKDKEKQAAYQREWQAKNKEKEKEVTKAKEGRPLRYKTAEELQAVFDKYFQEQDKKERPYTIAGLCRVSGLDFQRLLQYGKKEQFYETVKEAKIKVQDRYEESLQSKYTIGSIFALKQFGYSDRQEVTGKEGKDIVIKVVKNY